MARKLLKEALERGPIDKNPAYKVPGYKNAGSQETPHLALKSGQARELLKAINTYTRQGQHDFALIMLLLRTGLRRSECAALQTLRGKLYNLELWLVAYQLLAPNPGNLSAGVDGTTIDGTSLKLIQETIAELKAASYVPKPTRRIYLPKPNGKKRPISIPSFRDKLVQYVVKLVLEAIYEPTFAPTSHGFRPHHSCHTALEQVKQMRGTRWWIEGDIHAFFDTMEHQVTRNSGQTNY